MNAGMLQHFPFLDDGGKDGTNKRSRSEDVAEDEPLDANRKKIAKDKDPGAPKALYYSIHKTSNPTSSHNGFYSTIVPALRS